MSTDINTNKRLFDLVRFMRAELHQANLITSEEYAWLCSHTFPDDPPTGSPSPRRLEDYDSLRAQLKSMTDQFFAVSGQLGEARKLLEPLASLIKAADIDPADADDEPLLTGSTPVEAVMGVRRTFVSVGDVRRAAAHLAQSGSPGAGVKGEDKP